MNSKEALRILSECANGEKKLVFTDSLDLQKIVEKDLDKLEKLEKENEELKEQNERLYYNNQKLTRILKEVIE